MGIFDRLTYPQSRAACSETGSEFDFVSGCLRSQLVLVLGTELDSFPPRLLQARSVASQESVLPLHFLLLLQPHLPRSGSVSLLKMKILVESHAWVVSWVQQRAALHPEEMHKATPSFALTRQDHYSHLPSISV
jgi:hypothetical protein